MDDIEHPEAQNKWDTDRDETEAQRLDRNWSSLLQELRVAQTGVQLLTGFLLILPFQERFTQLDATMRTVYLITVGCSIGATVLLVAPVSMHRLLFRRHRLKTLVAASHNYAIAGTLLLGTALAGVAILVFDTVARQDRRLDRRGLHSGRIGRVLVRDASAGTQRRKQPLLRFASP